MSDFLSNFKSDSYKKTLGEKEQKKVESENLPVSESKIIHKEKPNLEASVARTQEVIDEAPLYEEEPIVDVEPATELDAPEATTESRSRRNESEEPTEIDPTYKKRKKQKIILFSAIGVVVILLLFWLYYGMTRVKMPEFIKKPISESRTWAADNKMDLDIKQEYSLKYETNIVMKQGITAGKKVKKGSKIKLTVSLGADPEELVPLPDFSKMSQEDANAWVKEKQTTNFSVLAEYNDTVEKGKFVRQEISNKEVTPETYRRKDTGIVYYSKGKEKFEKNIAMPDFSGKSKTEVETWVKTNEIAMTYEEVDSDKVAIGLIVSQSVPKDTKIAKRDGMTVQVSLGKAVVVPNFVELTPESAASFEGLMVTVKTSFSSEVSFGNLIAQTIASGTKLTEKDNKNITVTYSAGRPYLRSYMGKLEGDLAEAFYNDYQSKGGNIRYTVYYVDSAEEKGSVIKMSAYNEYVPLDYVVSIGISLGNLQGTPPPSSSDDAE